MAQPSDLKGGIPGKKNRDDVDQEIAQISQRRKSWNFDESSAQAIEATQGAEQAAAASAEEPEITPEMQAMLEKLAANQANVDAPEPSDPKVQEMLEKLSGNIEYIDSVEGQKAAEAPVNEDASEEEIEAGRAEEFGGGVKGFKNEIKARIAQNYGRNVKEEVSLLQKALGSEFELKSKGDEVWFRKKGSKKFFPIDRGAFSGGLREFVGDLVDFSGDALEIGSAIGSEVASVKAGAVAGAGAGFMVGGPAGAFVGGGIGAVGGAVAGIPASAFVSTAAREAAVRFFEGETSTDLAKEFEFNTKLNAATLGLGAILKSASKPVLNAFKEVLEMSPMKRVEELSEVRLRFEAVSKSIMGDYQPGTLAKGDVGDRLYSAIDSLDDKLDQALSFTRKQSIMDLGGRTRKVDTYVMGIEDMLEELNIPRSVLSRLPDPKFRAETIEFLKNDKAFGNTETGIRFAEHLIDEHVRINKMGGLSMSQLWNTLDELKGFSGYKQGATEQLPDKAMAFARRLRKQLSNDRNIVLQQAYSKSDPKTSKFMLDAMHDYSQKTDAIIQFKKMFTKSRESAEKFTNAIVQPENYKQIHKFRDLVGAESEEFALFQAEWFDRVMRDSINDVGAVDPVKLKKVLTKYGDRVVDTMVTPVQRVALENIAAKAAKIPYFDIINASQKEKQLMQDFAAVGLLGQRHPGPVIRLIWNTLGSNAEAVKYLADDGLLELAAKTKDPGKQSLLLKVTQSLRKMMDATDIVEKNGRKYLKPMDFDERLRDPQIQKVILEVQEKQRNEAARKGIHLPGAGSVTASEVIQPMAPQNE